MVYNDTERLLFSQDLTEYLNYRNTEWDTSDTDTDTSDGDTPLFIKPFGFIKEPYSIYQKQEPHCIPRQRIKQFVELCHYDAEVFKFVQASMKGIPADRWWWLKSSDIYEEETKKQEEILERIKSIGMFKRHEEPLAMPTVCSWLEQGGSMAIEYLDDGLIGIAIGDVSEFLNSTIETYQQNGKCTFGVTERNHIYQDWYTCATCDPNSTSISICLSCAEACHENHDLTYHKAHSIPNMLNFCDCGANDLDMTTCKC